METGSFQYESFLSFRHFHDYGRKDMHPRNAVWILLMVQKSGEHEFRLVGYPIIQRRFLHRRLCRYSSINSQYCHMKVWKQGYHFQRRDFVIFMLIFSDANEFLTCPNLLDIMSLCPSKLNLFEVSSFFPGARKGKKLLLFAMIAFLNFPSRPHCYKKQRQFIYLDLPYM